MLNKYIAVAREILSAIRIHGGGFGGVGMRGEVLSSGKRGVLENEVW